METEFKTLIYCGQYVDVAKLEEGIYSTLKPYLYKMDETIDSMAKKKQNKCRSLLERILFIATSILIT
jgi:hypothetical protein